MTTTSKKITVGSLFIVGLVAFFIALPTSSHAMTERGGLNMKKTMTEKATSTKPVMKDLSCVQEAVLARETAVATSWTTFNTAMVTALTKRTESLVAAWKITDAADRSGDLKDLWTTWKADSKKAHTTLRADRKTAWSDFRTTMKEDCRTTRLPKEDAEPRDASGAVTL